MHRYIITHSTHTHTCWLSFLFFSRLICWVPFPFFSSLQTGFIYVKGTQNRPMFVNMTVCVSRPIISTHCTIQFIQFVHCEKQGKFKPKTVTKVSSLTLRHFHVHIIRIQLHALLSLFIYYIFVASVRTDSFARFSIQLRLQFRINMK